jgi:spore coat protein JC
MWIYQKTLEFPVKIKNPNPALAKFIITTLGGPDGELAASSRYLSQRFGMPYREVTGILTDVGTEELSHVEMTSAIVYQLTRNLTPEQIKASGLDAYFVDHTAGIYPQAASGVPFSAMAFQSKGDIITDLNEDLAAEMKARTMYDNVLRLVDDPDVREPIKFLRAREVVHYQRFAEALGIAQERAECKSNFFLTNPSFDKKCSPPCPTCEINTTPYAAPEKNAPPKSSGIYGLDYKRPY